MAAGAALPGLFFTFAAMTLLVFASVSSPVWESVSFLNVGTGFAGRGITRFGVFGYTGSDTNVGYRFPAGFPQVPFGDNGQSVFRGLTIVLILIPIGAGFSALAFLFGLCGAAGHRVGTVFMTLLTSLAGFVTLVAFVVELVLFVTTRRILRDNDIPASLGNANWLVLGAFVALLFASVTSCCGVFGRYSTRRSSRY